MKQIKFQVFCGFSEKEIDAAVEIDGYEAFEMFGLKFGAYEFTEQTEGGTGGDFKVWCITELSSGFKLPANVPIFTMDEAIEDAKKLLKAKGEFAVIQAIKRAIQLKKEYHGTQLNETTD